MELLKVGIYFSGERYILYIYLKSLLFVNIWTFSLLNSLLANMFVMCLHQLIYTVLYCTVQGNVQQRPRDGNMDDVNWTYSDIVICKIIYRCFDQACIQISSDIYKI